jgi:hypothetical protein
MKWGDARNPIFMGDPPKPRIPGMIAAKSLGSGLAYHDQ